MLLKKTPAISQIQFENDQGHYLFIGPPNEVTLPPSMLVELRKQLSSVQLGRDTSRFPSADVTLLDRHLFMYHGHTIKFSLRSI